MPETKIKLRSIVVGLLGMALITSSSMFMALKIGTMPWPILFGTILSMIIIGKMRDSSKLEIAVTETIMASGAMVSAGVVFTIPGVWMIDSERNIKAFPILVTMLVAVALGLLFSALYRKKLIEEEDLAFPHGNASYETINTGLGKGKDSKILFSSMGFSAIFAFNRDAVGVIPSRITLFGGNNLISPVSLWLSPMALSLGAMINQVSAFMWLLGAIVAFFVFTPLSISLGFFSSMGVCDEFRKNIGIGIVIGTGIGVLVKAVLGIIKDGKNGKEERNNTKVKNSFYIPLLVSILSVLVVSLFTPIGIMEAVLAVLGIGLSVLLSGMLTGQCGMNPLEVFGILVMMLSLVLFKSGEESLFLIAAMVSTACGLTGVLMNDFKCGKKLGLDWKVQIKAEAIGAFSAAILSTAMIFLIKKSIGTFGTDTYPAPQAAAVASIINGSGDKSSLIWGIIIGFILYLMNVPSATFGLGFYLPLHISLSMGIGAIISFVLKKKNMLTVKDINLLSSGFMAGEGVIGVFVAIKSIFI